MFRNLSCSTSSSVRIQNLEEGSDKQIFREKKTKSILREFEKLTVWKDENSLVEDLYSNIVYYEPERDKSGVVILNKPYGLAKEKSDDSQFCLVKALPLLAKKLDVPSLTVLKCTERFTSGITVLGSKPHSEKAFRSSLNHQKSNRILANSYIALVKGQPSTNRTESVDLSLANCPQVKTPLFSSMHKEPVISRQLKTRSQGRRMKVQRFHVDVRTVSKSSSGTGLVQISPSKTGKHFILVYLAELGNPVLGDMLYDYRSRTILGQRVKVTAATNARRIQTLQPHLLELLGLEKGEEWRLPRLLHHHRLHLPSWLPAGEDVTVFAPPPPHWLRACQILGIKFNFKDFVKEDEVMQYKARERKPKEKDTQTVITDLQADVSDLT